MVRRRGVRWQCGPVRYQVNARAQAASRPFEHLVLVQPTPFQPNRNPDPDKRVEFQTLYQELTADQARTRRICEDVIDAVQNGRSPLILTERNDYLDRFAQELATRVDHVVVLRAGMGKKQRHAIHERLAAIPRHEGRGASHSRDRQVRWRGIRRSAFGHVVSNASCVLARNRRAHCRAMPEDAEGAARARSATEAFLYRRLDTLTETGGRFRLDVALPIPFDGFGTLEVDLLCADARLVIELDGGQHLADPVAYRRDRRKDQLLQENGYFVLRFLAEDVGKDLDAVLDAILRVLARHRQSAAKAEPLKFVRRGGE